MNTKKLLIALGVILFSPSFQACDDKQDIDLSQQTEVKTLEVTAHDSLKDDEDGTEMDNEINN